MPTGFVKSTIQAPGAASSRTRSAISRTTGTVRIALAKPPAPVVSWPMQPQASGAVSSCRRAVCPPTRIWTSTKSAPSTAASRSSVTVSPPVYPACSSMRAATSRTAGSSSTSRITPPPVQASRAGCRSRLTLRIRRRRAGSVDATTDAIRAVACIRFVRRCGRVHTGLAAPVNDCAL